MTETQQILMREIRAGLAGRLTLVAIEGPDPDRLATISLQLGDRLRANELVDYVGNVYSSGPHESKTCSFRRVIY